MTDRAHYISGLRKLADALEANPGVPLPFNVLSTTIYFFEDYSTDPEAVRRGMLETSKALGGRWDKRPEGDYFDMTSRLGGEHGLSVKLCAHRDSVCERKVVGVREVEKRVPVGHVEYRTETVEEEIVEWECPPSLREGVTS